jgi:galactokinase/mevalonate kinase-like predicted kinase
MRARGQEPDLSSEKGRTAFAELLRDVELNDAGVKCGYQDAYMISHGGLRFMQFPGKHPVQGGPFGTTEALPPHLPFLLVTTGVERLSGSVHGPMIDRWLAGERAVVDTMIRLADLAREGREALIGADYTALGRLMDENHHLVAALGGSGEAIDQLIARCRHYGARGAKLAGAGLGGTVIALTEDADRLEQSLRGEGYARFMRPAIEPGVRYE